MTGKRARRFDQGRLVVASHNAGKVREFSDLLACHSIDVTAAAELGLPKPEESGTTFQANAEIKARAAVNASGLPALADDSGLVVDALDGAPGIFSARWAGPKQDFELAMRSVEDGLRKAGAATTRQGRYAHFVAALALAWPDGHVEIFEGTVRGALVWPPRGDRGFGYDPMFVPNGHDVTFGEMAPEEKNIMSHRADSFQKLVAACFEA